MNKFLNRKKAPEGVVTANNDTQNALTSPATLGAKKSTTSRWKKSKKEPEPKPEELNIAAALPASDDFRTSLLMPNLSARFSMLREQDDPNSLLGKASDDSVLQPRRRSRMLDYGYGSNGLNDIAEVQSINSSIRPPFASYSRQDSYASEDGYGSENESTLNASMMSRARPGEGNVLFGGRQKVYKIPTSGAQTSARLGKAVYEDDLGTSAFQKHRMDRKPEGRSASGNQEAHMAREEHGRQAANEEPMHLSNQDQGFDFGLDDTSEHTSVQMDAGAEDHYDMQTATPNDSAKDLAHSPSTSLYNKKRSTSSTTRSEARSSTAATSVASQPNAPMSVDSASQGPLSATAMPPLKRADTKTRRLYEQGLDQHMHEQQTTALTRLNSIQRQRSLLHGKQQPSPFLQSAKSAGNIHEHVKRPVYALRAQSPPAVVPLAPLITMSSMHNPSSGNASPMLSGPTSPISPQAMDYEDVTPLNQALDPNDRGKATAMGFFDKPAQQFDEKQYLERQQHLQRSLSKPGMRKDSTAFQARIGRFEQMDRDRSASDASTRSRSGSAPKAVPKNLAPKSLPKRGDSLRKRREPTQAYNVFQNAANSMSARQGAQQYDTHRTFFGNISASDSEEDDDEHLQEGVRQESSDIGYGGVQARWQPTALPSVSEHPALRSQASPPSLLEEEEEEEEDQLEPRPLRPVASVRSLRQDVERLEVPATAWPDAVDSPTLGPSTSEPLSGMMHHLRNKSNGSSLYPNDEGFQADEVPELPDMSWNARSPDDGHPAFRRTMDSDARIESSYTNSNSNPWDLDDIDNVYDIDDSIIDRSSSSPVNVARSQGSFARAPSRATVQTNRQSEVSQYSDVASDKPWQKELRTQHSRDASTGTQQERDAFADELAARRNAIQENMKSMVEGTQSRNVSPAPSVNGAFKAFGMLRSKSSRESVDPSRGPSAPSKAMKMLGIGAHPSNTTLSSQYERSLLSYDATKTRDNSVSRTRENSVSRTRENSLSRTRENSVSRVPPIPTSMPRAPQPNDWERGVRARGDSEAGKPTSQPPTRHSPVSSQADGMRSRSNSVVTTGRSRSRTGPYRDDLERAMVEGMGSSAAGHPELSPLVPHELTPKPSPDVMQSDAGPRARSNSRPPTDNYFNPKNVLSVYTAQGRQTPVGPSPVTLSSNVYSPTNKAMRPPPAVSPIVQMPTPPVSGANTPQGTTPVPHPNMPTIQPRTGILRKKTVSKASISEPTLISSTSNVDTIDLPVGASLKNGMDSSPPPLPPINPRRLGARKVFGIGRSNMSDDAMKYENYGRSRTPDPWMSRKTPEPDFAFGSGARPGIDGRPNIHPQQGMGNQSTPALQQYGYQQPLRSPERVERSPVPKHHATMEGGMF